MSFGPWSVDSSGLHVCARVVYKSDPFDADQAVEIKYEFATCHGLRSGGMQTVIDLEDAKKLMIGDQFMVTIRPF